MTQDFDNFSHEQRPKIVETACTAANVARGKALFSAIAKPAGLSSICTPCFLPLSRPRAAYSYHSHSRNTNRKPYLAARHHSPRSTSSPLSAATQRVLASVRHEQTQDQSVRAVLYLNAGRRPQYKQNYNMAIPATGTDRKKFYFQCITTPSPDTPGSTVILHFDNRRYLFGQVAEGTQRALNERGISLKKSRTIFLTGETRWKFNGGLLGMILTMADYQSEASEEEKAAMGPIGIWGGPKLFHTMACARRFIFRTGMPLRVQETNPVSWSPDSALEFSDDNISVWSLPAIPRLIPRHPPTQTRTRSSSPGTVDREQTLRAQTVHNMFDSDWRKDRLVEAVFSEVSLPAMVWVRDNDSKELHATFCTKLEDAPHIKPDQHVFVRTPWPAALVTELPPADNLPSSMSMSYIIKAHSQRGQFDPLKAKSLGLEPGPNYGKLARGETITLPDGRVIRPEDVVGPTEPGKGAAILDVPAESYLSDLSNKLLLLKQTDILAGIEVFIWLVDQDIVQSQSFIALQAQFPHVRHVISSPETSPINLTMDSSAASAARLHQIRPSCFPLPLYDNAVPAHNPFLFQNGNVQAQRMLKLEFAPKFDIKRDEVVVNLNLTNTKQWTDPVIQQLTTVAAAAFSSSSVQVGEFDNIQVTTLGTGSAMPSKYRNVSANLVSIPGLGYFLFDAGENTLGQLKRAFAPKHLENILCNLHMIWISHLHADHHLGTISVLLAAHEARQRRKSKDKAPTHKVYLVSEPNMADFLQDYSSVENTHCDMLKCLKSSLTDLDGRPVLLSDTTLPIRELATTRVSHCHGAQAVSVTFRNGFKLSYSGDCRPSARFAQIGANSDILIHEATFDDGLEGDAIAKKHSTIGEALGVASAMKAKNVILTHFSQRYQKLPTLKHIRFVDQIPFEEGNDSTDPTDPLEFTEQIAGQNSTFATFDQSPSSRPHTPTQRRETTLLAEAAKEMAICVAFDLMQVNIPQIQDMYRYYPVIERMFDLEEQKSEARRADNRNSFETLVRKQEELAAARREQHRAPKPDSKRQKRRARNDPLPAEATSNKPLYQPESAHRANGADAGERREGKRPKLAATLLESG